MSRATACFSMYSLMSKRMNSLPSSSASCLASSVLPTPVGPVNRKQPDGRSGSASPARDRLMACATRCTASCWPKTTRSSDSSSMRSRSRSEDDACRAGMRAIRATIGSMSATSTTVDRRVARPLDVDTAPAFNRRHRAGFVDQIDGAVGQAIVAQVPRRQLGRALERRIGVFHAVVLFVPAAQPGQNAHGLFDRRLVDRDLLQAPRQRAILFDVLELFERRRADHAQLAGGQQRLQHGREIHRAAGDGAGADRRVNLVDEEDGLRPRAQRFDDGFEALFEIAAKARAREQRARVEREDLGVLQRVLHVIGEQPHRQPFGHRRLADAGVADEHGIVLAPPAEHFDGALQLVGAADERIEQSLPRARGQVRAIGRQRILRGRRSGVAAAGDPVAAVARVGRSAIVVVNRRLGDAVREVLEHVEPRDALFGQQRRRPRLRLLQDGRDQIAHLRFLPLRALHVQHRRLQRAAECRRLLGLALLSARKRFDRVVQAVGDVSPQQRQVGAARARECARRRDRARRRISRCSSVR